MGTTLTLQTPADFLFRRDVCSYGYFILQPNRWNPESHTLTRALNLPDGIATATIAQPSATPERPNISTTNRIGQGTPLKARFDRALSRTEQRTARQQLTRMLRLDESPDHIAAFHAVDPRWKGTGRGRLFRSPTLFEDIIKTVTSCNVQWTGTIRMNQRLCDVINPAFPRPAQLARRKPATLRTRCGMGYRDQRVVQLAKLFAAGDIDHDQLENPSTSDEHVRTILLSLPGIGPYAAANIMQLLGRYSHVAIDTETVRHAKMVLGMTGQPRAIEKQAAAHYAAYGDQQFRSYWFELWDFYEHAKGPAYTWNPRTTGTEFTKANLIQTKPKSR